MRSQSNPDWVTKGDVESLFKRATSYSDTYNNRFSMTPDAYQLEQGYVAAAVRLCVPTPVAACLMFSPATPQITVFNLRRTPMWGSWSNWGDNEDSVQCAPVSVCLSDPCANSTNSCCKLVGSVCAPDNSHKQEPGQVGVAAIAVKVLCSPSPRTYSVYGALLIDTGARLCVDIFVVKMICTSSILSTQTFPVMYIGRSETVKMQGASNSFSV